MAPDENRVLVAQSRFLTLRSWRIRGRKNADPKGRAYARSVVADDASNSMIHHLFASAVSPSGEIMNVNETIFDVCVVGSGAAGGTLSSRLASRGLNVIVLEGGPRIDPSRAF